MTPFTELDQQTLDIDWFFTNGEYIGMVASGGGILPASVAISQESNGLLNDYFQELPHSSDYVINPELNTILGGKANERYLSSFIGMAQKGLFAFDKIGLGRLDNSLYHWVAAPKRPLTLIETPNSISSILKLTFAQRGSFTSILDISIIT